MAEGTRQSKGFGQYNAINGLTYLSVNPAQGIAAPSGAYSCQLQNQGVGDLRWRDDGTAPTTSVGMLLKDGATLDYDGDIDKLQFIPVGAATPTVAVTYYGLGG